MDKERIIQEFVPGKQVTLAHLIAHPGEELAKKIGVPDAGAIGIMTLTPGETMKRIAFVGTVGAGKTTLFNALQGNYTLARKTQAVEFNDKGDIDTPGEYFSHPRWYHALITTLQDVDMLIYVHGANDPESRLPAGLLDIGVSKRQIAVISKTDMPDADVAATRKLLLETGFEEPIFELNSHDPQSVQQLVDYLASLTKQEEAGEKTHHSE